MRATLMKDGEAFNSIEIDEDCEVLTAEQAGGLPVEYFVFVKVYVMPEGCTLLESGDLEC